MTLEGYDVLTGSGFSTTYSDIASAIADGSIDFNNGKFSLHLAKVYMGESNDLMNFYDRVGNLQKVGYASRNDLLDASNETDDLVLVAKKKFTLTGGAGDDTIFATERSFIDGDDGLNQIYLADGGKSTVILSGNGRNIIHGFNIGFNNTSDKILIESDSTFNSFDGTNLTIKSGSARAKLKNISAGDSFVKIFETDSDGNIYKVAVAQSSSIIAAGSDTADIFIGENSDVDFTSFKNSLFVDLRNLDNQKMKFYGINKVTAGEGQNTLIGDDNRNTLIAGNGYTSIWGGTENSTRKTKRVPRLNLKERYSQKRCL